MKSQMRWSAAQALSWIICSVPNEIDQWTAQMGPKIKDAQVALARSLGSERVRAWGRQQPHAALQQVPAGQFSINGCPVVVDVHGSMVSRQPHKPYSGPLWGSVEFDSNEIKKAFPPPPPQTANAWMLNEAEQMANQGRKGKQDYLVKRCREETDCTRDEARRAYKALPDKLKLRPGRPSQPPRK